MTGLDGLYQKFEQTPFPMLGGLLGNFGLYDRYFAGYVRSVRSREPPPPEAAMQPDHESAVEIAALRAKPALDPEERALLGYVDLMDDIREAIYRPEWAVPPPGPPQAEAVLGKPDAP